MADQIQVKDLQAEKQIQIITDVNQDGTFHNKATTTVEAEDFEVVIKDLGSEVLRARPECFVDPKEGDVIALVNIIKGFLFLEDPEDIAQQILNAQLAVLIEIRDGQKEISEQIRSMNDNIILIGDKLDVTNQHLSQGSEDTITEDEAKE